MKQDLSERIELCEIGIQGINNAKELLLKSYEGTNKILYKAIFDNLKSELTNRKIRSLLKNGEEPSTQDKKDLINAKNDMTEVCNNKQISKAVFYRNLGSDGGVSSFRSDRINKEETSFYVR